MTTQRTDEGGKHITGINTEEHRSIDRRDVSIASHVLQKYTESIDTSIHYATAPQFYSDGWFLLELCSNLSLRVSKFPDGERKESVGREG